MENLTFDDVLLIPQRNPYDSRRMVETGMTDETGKLSLRLPVMTANMDTITEDAMANFIGSKGGIGVLHRFMSIDDNVKMFQKCEHDTFVSVGASERELERVEALKNHARYFCVDVAHGHADYVERMIKRMREMLGDSYCIMAGNVATLEGAQFLADAGADIIKVGIGPGSVCTTRIKTGYGVPQLTAILECKQVDRSIVADGGLRDSGDIVKALALGADFVMIGGMLSGTAPTPGQVHFEPARPYSAEMRLIVQMAEKMGIEIPCDGGVHKYKTYRGMASKEVADDYHGGLAEWKTAEGVATKVPYREDESAIIADIVGGLRSGLTYGGSKDIRELQRKVKWVRITNAGRRESLPHKTL